MFLDPPSLTKTNFLKLSNKLQNYEQLRFLKPFFDYENRNIGHDGLPEVQFLSSVGVGCNEASSGHLSL